MEDSTFLKDILLKHIQGTISAPERAMLLSSLEDGAKAAEWKQLIEELSSELSFETNYNEQDWAPMLSSILRDKEEPTSIVPTVEHISAPVHRIHFLRTAWFRYAAAVVVVASVGSYLWLSGSLFTKTQQISTISEDSNPLLKETPGGNKATLTLADGSTIILDSVANGNLASQGSTQVIKLDNGLLAYQAAQQATSDKNKKGNLPIAPIGYNTIATPVGGQYQVTLPDGSKVWLNAASSIHFPTVFNKERNVTITGEAYFEIAADKSRPFLVNANNLAVKVLSTSFNVNAYNDEPEIKTTLIEGSVRVEANNEAVLLKPSQQSSFSRKASKQAISTILTEDAIAWKNNIFNFHHAKLPAVMRQLKRWYNIDIRYQNGIPDIEFWGKIRRDMTLAQMIEFLQKSDVQCHLENDRELVITSKP